MSAVVNQANFTNIVQKGVDKIFYAKLGEIPDMIPMLFSVQKPEQAIVTELLLSDIGGASLWNGTVIYDDVKETYKKQVEEQEYTLGLKVTEKLMRNDLYSAIPKQIKLIAERFMDKKQAVGAEIFNGAFSTALTADGLSLCNSSHTSYVGGSTQSNTGTSAFSPAAVEAARQLFIKFKTDRDNKTFHYPDTIIVGTGNEEKAYELISTSGQVDTANNNINFHKGKYKVVVWHNYLNDDDWFLCNSSRMKDEVTFYEWLAPEFRETDEFDTRTKKYAGFMSNAVSAADWRFVFGNNV